MEWGEKDRAVRPVKEITEDFFSLFTTDLQSQQTVVDDLLSTLGHLLCSGKRSKLKAIWHMYISHVLESLLQTWKRDAAFMKICQEISALYVTDIQVVQKNNYKLFKIGTK